MESQILGNGSAFGLHAEAKAIEAAVATAEGPDSYEGVKKSSEVVEGTHFLLLPIKLFYFANVFTSRWALAHILLVFNVLICGRFRWRNA